MHLMISPRLKIFSSLVIAVCTASPAAAISYHVEELTSDLHIPMQAAVVPGFEDKIFIAQLGGTFDDIFDDDPITDLQGRIVIYDRNTGQVDYNNPFLEIGDTSVVDPFSVPEVGLFSMAFHPEFQTNGKLYVNVAVEHDDPGNPPQVDFRTSPFKTVLREYTVNVNNPSLPITGERTIFELNQPAVNHNGSWLGFNPLEVAEGKNYLYITQGDGGDQHDPAQYGQDPHSWFGTVMRIDVDGDDFGGDPDRNYAIPDDNPFVGGGGAEEVWAYGLRNPYRGSFDPETGDFYVGDVGQGWYEEIDLIPAGTSGQNFGWRPREGSQPTPTGGVGGPKPPGAIDPIYEYLHEGREGWVPGFEGSSVTGGVVYRGPVEELQGKYFFADNVSQNIWMFDPADPTGTVQRMNDLLMLETGPIIGITSFDTDENGNMLIVAGTGQVYTLLPNTPLTVTVNREDGSMTFANLTGESYSIESYELSSASGGIDPLEITSITDNYDNSWQITDADNFEFSEEATEEALLLADGQSFVLSDDNGWIQSPYEDLLLSIELEDGSTIAGIVAFEGNGGEPFVRSDLNFDGSITLADWSIFNDGHLVDLDSLTRAQRYGMGDLDDDGDNDFDDFVLFKADYDAIHGVGALAEALSRVPEPTSVCLVLLAVSLASGPRRRREASGPIMEKQRF